MASIPYAVVRDSVGAYLVGACVTIFLTGWTLHQAISYYDNYRRDPKITKIVVGVLTLFSILHLAFVFHNLYYWLIIHYGSIAAFGKVPATYGLNFILLASTTAFVQIWYARRIYVLGGKERIMPLLVTFCALFQFAFGTAAGISTIQLKFQRKFGQTPYIAYCWLGGAGFADFIIVCLMSYYLLKARQGFEGTTSVVNRILLIIVQSNSITSLLQILDLILFLTVRSGWNIAINIVLIPLYCNSVITLLLARDKLKKETSGSSGHKVSSGGVSGAFELRKSRMSRMATQVTVHTNTQIQTETYNHDLGYPSYSTQVALQSSELDEKQ